MRDAENEVKIFRLERDVAALRSIEAQLSEHIAEKDKEIERLKVVNECFLKQRNHHVDTSLMLKEKVEGLESKLTNKDKQIDLLLEENTKVKCDLIDSQVKVNELKKEIEEGLQREKWMNERISELSSQNAMKQYTDEEIEKMANEHARKFFNPVSQYKELYIACRNNFFDGFKHCLQLLSSQNTGAVDVEDFIKELLCVFLMDNGKVRFEFNEIDEIVNSSSSKTVRLKIKNYINDRLVNRDRVVDVPSDEEIDSHFEKRRYVMNPDDALFNRQTDGMRQGAKWMRDKLLPYLSTKQITVDLEGLRKKFVDKFMGSHRPNDEKEWQYVFDWFVAYLQTNGGEAVKLLKWMEDKLNKNEIKFYEGNAKPWAVWHTSPYGRSFTSEEFYAHFHFLQSKV